MHKYIYFPLIAGFLFLTFMTSCRNKHVKPYEKTVADTGQVNYEIRQIIESQLEQFRSDSLLIIDEDTIITGNWIYTLFSENNFEPLWSNENKLLPAADSLLAVIKSARSYGLIPENYFHGKMPDKINLFNDPVSYKINVTRIYEINILLTDAFFRFIVHLKKGRLNPLTFSKEWKGESIDTDPVLTLSMALLNNSINKTIESFEPKSRMYDQLKSNLAYLLHSPKNDSSEININSIIANMERCRWEIIGNEDYHIEINIPSFTLKLFSCDTLTMVSKVITGKPETPTPFYLDSKITYFIVYPYWFVPFSITTKEILPVLKKDTSYLSKHNMEIMDRSGKIINANSIKWKKYSEKYFPYIIRQRDGDENTLGVLKFIFSNKYGIYLHDTNSRYLFEKEYRALSHGCVRMEKAKELASFITDCCAINFGPDSLEKYILNKERRKVILYTPLPVHIRYYTVEADSENVYYYDDVYKIDERVLSGLK